MLLTSPSNMMKAIIVEDSRLARLQLNELLKDFPQLEVIAEAANYENALKLIPKHKPDVIFLDISLPGGDGFDLLEELVDVPPVIFTTAYDQYAIKAFDVNALDYLLKPINPTHLARAIDRITLKQANQNEAQHPTAVNTKIFVREAEQCWLIETEKIRYIESIGNHTRIYFDKHKPYIYKSLTQVTSKLPTDTFFRANRQYTININFIENVNPGENSRLLVAMSDNKKIELSRRSSALFKQNWSL